VKYRALAVLPLLVAVVVVATASTVAGRALSLEVMAAKGLGAVGLAAAGLSLARGDYLRRGYLFGAACYVLLVLRDVTYFVELGPSPLGVRLELWRGAVVAFANTFGVLGTWTLARVWNAAGIDLTAKLPARLLVVAAAAFFAVLLTGASFVEHVRALAGGALGPVVSVVSDVADAISLCLIAPVVLVALAMRGGILRWPWGFFAASLVLWLAYDAATAIGPLLHVAPFPARTVADTLRSAASAFALSAGIAQRLVVGTATRPE
jgi:hypothetical protein